MALVIVCLPLIWETWSGFLALASASTVAGIWEVNHEWELCVFMYFYHLFLSFYFSLKKITKNLSKKRKRRSWGTWHGIAGEATACTPLGNAEKKILGMLRKETPIPSHPYYRGVSAALHPREQKLWAQEVIQWHGQLGTPNSITLAAPNWGLK